MDIKTLLNNLHEEVSCSVCMNTFTDPKQLPCLHSFCLHCLNGIQRTSGRNDIITCPECRRESRVPGSGSLNELPTNFRINSLLDVLAIKECNTTGAKCGNCDKKSSQSFYCFQCCAFWCDDCITGHNIIRANKEHRVLALKDFQDEDYENVLKRPAFCPKKHHEKEELKFFCTICEVAICNACALTDHEGHAKILLEEAANERKLQVKYLIESQKQKAQQKRNKITQLEQTCIQIQEQTATVKRNAQKFAEKMISVIEAKKQEIFHKAESHARESLQRLAKQKSEIEHQVKMADKAVEQTETVLKQSTSAEIVQLDKSLNTIFQEGVNDEGEQADCDLEGLHEFIFVENETLMDKTNTEGIGSFKVLKKTRTHQSSAEGNVRGSSFAAEVKPRQFRPVLSFGQRGSSVGMLSLPCGVAVNERDEIAVTDRGNHGVQVFSSDGTYLRSFGSKGNKQGEFDMPTGIAFDSNGNILVSDSNNHRVQVFSEQGEYLSKFGGLGSLDHQLNAPHGLSVDSDGNIIIADRGNKLIKIFSPNGQFLRKIGRDGSFTFPFHCVHYEKYFIVSDFDEHCIKVFGEEGNFLYTFGKKGEGDGEFNKPRCLSVNKAGHLMVCDESNHRVQVFELSGKFITKFGKGSGLGKFNGPISTAVLSDGRIVVTDFNNHRIQIFQ